MICNRMILRAIKFLLVLCLFSHGYSYASTVTGRIFVQDLPRQGIAVTIQSRNTGTSTPSFTNNRGYYSLHRVPPGRYILKIWITPYQAQTYPVNVYNRPFTNLGTFRLF